MAGEAGAARPSLGAAQRDHPTVLGKVVERGRLGRRATCQQGRGGERKNVAHGIAIHVSPRLFPILMARSEEHTSELQSLMRNSYAVFCLIQKNKQMTTTIVPPS